MQTVNIAIYVSIAVVALYGVLRGLRKGLYKSLIDLGVTVIAAALSIWIAKLVSKTLVSQESILELIDFISGKMPELSETLINVEDTITSLSGDSNLLGMVMALPAIILAPFIFMLLYLVIGFVLKIPKWIIARVIFGKNSGDTYRGGSRLFGAIVGAVVRVLSIALFIIPIVGYVNIANDALLGIGEGPQSLEEAEVDFEDSQLSDSIQSVSDTCMQMHDEYTGPISDNFAVKSIYVCGGKWIFNTLSSAKVDDVKISLSEEIDVVVSVYSEATVLASPIAEYDEKQTQAITNISETLDRAKIMPCIISGVLSNASQAWLDGEAIFGYEKIDVGEYYEPALDKLLTMLASTSEDTVKEDIHTLANVLNICIEQDFLKETLENGIPMETLEREAFLGEIFVELHKNDRTRPIIQDLINALKCYIYRIYNDVNGTNIPYPSPLVMEMVTEQMMYDEGALLANIVRDFGTFYESFDMSETDNTTLLIETDLRSLGKALDNLEKSLLLGDSYEFLLEAILRSEGASQIAFLTPEFAEVMLNSDSSMETVLVSRQQIAIILSAATASDRSKAIEHLIENVDSETAKVIMETLTPEILWNFGMDWDKSQAMSQTVGSLIQEIAKNEEMTEEQKKSEIEAVDTIVSTVQAATDKVDSSENVFATHENDKDSYMSMTADDLVETIVESSIVSSAVNSATVDENGNAIEDPYKISGKLSETDKSAAKEAIESYYAENALEGEENEELEKTLGSLATIFGVSVELNK